MSREYKAIFLKEAHRVFSERSDIDPRAQEYLKWLRDFKYLDRSTTEFALRERYRPEW